MCLNVSRGSTGCAHSSSKETGEGRSSGKETGRGMGTDSGLLAGAVDDVVVVVAQLGGVLGVGSVARHV